MPDGDFSVRVRVEGQEPYMRALGTAPAAFHADLRKTAERAADMVANRAIVNMRSYADQGGLIRSTRGIVEGSGVHVRAIAQTTARHAAAVHHGRGAGKRPPPTAAIAAWIERRGGDVRLAFVAAKNIGKRGIKGRPYMTDALKQTRARVDRLWRDAAERLADHLRGKG